MSRFVSATVITITVTSKITTGIQGKIIITGVIGMTMETGSIIITEDIRITTTTRIKGTKKRLIASVPLLRQGVPIPSYSGYVGPV